MTTSLSRALPLLLVAAPVAAQEVTLPSGLEATLFDVVLEEAEATAAPDAFTDPEGEEAADAATLDLGDEPLNAPPPEEADLEEADPLGEEAVPGGIARFRLVVPELASAGYDRVAGDFAWICETLALPALAANGWGPTEVVVSLSDRETAFGATDAEATQFFEGFRIGEGACVPQAF